MRAISSYLDQLEHRPDLQGAVIRATKIRRTLMEILELKNIPSDAEFQFKDRLKHLLERCNRALEREKSLLDNIEPPPNPPNVSANEDGRSIVEADWSTPGLGIGKAYF